MNYLLNPVHQLEMRLDFLQGILEIGFLCNFNKEQLEEIQDMLLKELAYVDNLMYEVFEQTGEHALAFEAWHAGMEGIRRWLSLITEVKIKYA